MLLRILVSRTVSRSEGYFCNAVAGNKGLAGFKALSSLLDALFVLALSTLSLLVGNVVWLILLFLLIRTACLTKVSLR